MIRQWVALLLLSYWHGSVVLCENKSFSWDFLLTPEPNLLASIIETHYREIDTYVNIRVRNGNSSEATAFQQDLITDVVLSEPMMAVSYGDLSVKERPAYYNVFLVQDYHSLCNLLAGMSYRAFQFYGLYTIFLQHSTPSIVAEVMKRLWSLWIINVVVIVHDTQDLNQYVAYSYHPYREGMCGLVEPLEIGRFDIDGEWNTTDGWFSDRLANFHGCPLKVSAIEVKPYSMIRLEDGNRTVHYGLEVYTAETIASRLNFSMQYVMPKDNVKWGILYEQNSTGVVGLIQRREIDFGYGGMGHSLSRHTFLKQTTPSHVTEMSIAIPPKRPYTSLEKLFQPFTVDAWICIACGYLTFAVLTIFLVRLSAHFTRQRLPNPLYKLWVMLMGGSSAQLQLNSWRIFVMGFILNTLVIRTLYQAAMFQRLQASETLASDLDTLSAINREGLNYLMFRSSMQFYLDNPAIPKSRIRVVQNDKTNPDEIFYDLSRRKLGSVFSFPFDCIAYYVKQYGQRGIVYVSKYTGFSFKIGMHFPKQTPLVEPFNAWIHRLQAVGLTHHWTEEFRDNRYWNNAKQDPEPAGLKWDQISGGFLLCSFMLALASVVFFGELIYFHLVEGRLHRAQNKPEKVE